MALKDWKKINIRREMDKWEDNYGRWIYITKTKNISGKKVYGVDSNDPNFYNNMQFFKTKQEALKFAKEYMRKH